MQITHLSAHIVHVFNLKLLKDLHIPHCQIIFRANCTLNSLSKMYSTTEEMLAAVATNVGMYLH